MLLQVIDSFVLVSLELFKFPISWFIYTLLVFTCPRYVFVDLVTSVKPIQFCYSDIEKISSVFNSFYRRLHDNF